MMPAKKGKLFLIPTELADASPSLYLPEYNRCCMLRLKHFIVENVRTSRRFLKKIDPAIDINELCFYEIDKHQKEMETHPFLKPLLEGEDMGLMSEAGCPAVADPGAKIVAAAHKKGIIVRPLVGPSSILLGLMASGLNGQSFHFLGYLPIKEPARSAKMRAMASSIGRDHCTQIFIETPYRNMRTIEELCNILPPHFLLSVGTNLNHPQKEMVCTASLAEWRHKDVSYLQKQCSIFLLNDR